MTAAERGAAVKAAVLHACLCLEQQARQSLARVIRLGAIGTTASRARARFRPLNHAAAAEAGPALEQEGRKKNGGEEHGTEEHLARGPPCCRRLGWQDGRERAYGGMRPGARRTSARTESTSNNSDRPERGRAGSRTQRGRHGG